MLPFCCFVNSATPRPSLRRAPYLRLNSLGSHCSASMIYVTFPSPDAQFVRVAPLSETDNPEDDKVYVFFTERAQEAEGAAGKVLYSRVARVCKVRGFFFCLFVLCLTLIKLSASTVLRHVNVFA